MVWACMRAGRQRHGGCSTRYAAAAVWPPEVQGRALAAPPHRPLPPGAMPSSIGGEIGPPGPPRRALVEPDLPLARRRHPRAEQGPVPAPGGFWEVARGPAGPPSTTWRGHSSGADRGPESFTALPAPWHASQRPQTANPPANKGCKAVQRRATAETHGPGASKRPARRSLAANKPGLCDDGV